MRWYILIVIFIILFELVSLVLLPKSKVSELSISTNEEKVKLRSMFRHVGTEKTYEYYKTFYAEYPEYVVHVRLSHWIGNEIYLREGLSGIRFCDDAYNWGCYHGFIGRAISEEGIDTMYRIEETCRKTYQGNVVGINGCVHGVGHGLMASEGYEYKHLVKALDRCDTFTYIPSKEQCLSGVFMENNSRLMEQFFGRKVVPREFNPEDPYDPCDKLIFKYQTYCYLELPARWWNYVNHDVDKMEKLCRVIENVDNRNSCLHAFEEFRTGSRFE
jgi:hypothetical protein